MYLHKQPWCSVKNCARPVPPSCQRYFIKLTKRFHILWQLHFKTILAASSCGSYIHIFANKLQIFKCQSAITLPSFKCPSVHQGSINHRSWGGVAYIYILYVYPENRSSLFHKCKSKFVAKSACSILANSHLKTGRCCLHWLHSQRAPDDCWRRRGCHQDWPGKHCTLWHTSFVLCGVRGLCHCVIQHSSQI